MNINTIRNLRKSLKEGTKELNHITQKGYDLGFLKEVMDAILKDAEVNGYVVSKEFERYLNFICIPWAFDKFYDTIVRPLVKSHKDNMVAAYGDEYPSAPNEAKCPFIKEFLDDLEPHVVEEICHFLNDIGYHPEAMGTEVIEWERHHLKAYFLRHYVENDIGLHLDEASIYSTTMWGFWINEDKF